MMMGHGGAAIGVLSLIVSTAFLVWAAGQTHYRKFAQVIAWIAILISALMVISHAMMCYNMCKSGQCMRMGPGMMRMEKMMGGEMGKDMGPDMNKMNMPAEEAGKKK